MQSPFPISEDVSIEARGTPEGRLCCDVVTAALVDMAGGRERDDGRTAEAFFFEPDPRCDNQLRADRWCSLLSFEPDFVRKIAREIASGKIDVSRRLEDYRAQRDRYRRELRLAVRSPAAGSWLK